VIRVEVPEREGWRERFDELGFSFHSMDGLYWLEGLAYEFTSSEIDYLDDVTQVLHDLCLEAVDHVVRRNLFSRLAIPPAWEECIRRSWQRNDPSLYGRFDLVHDGKGETKLIEYNADTPTSLIESSIAQWVWLEESLPGYDQFNSIHEKLLDGLQGQKGRMGAGEILYFGSVRDHEEDFVTVEYMRDVALQAGLDARHIWVDEIGYSAESGDFRDLEGLPIEHLFKLYPWEWLMAEPFGQHLLAEPFRTILEPPWKAVLANKGILALLWEMFPNHPNLLPASLSPLAGVERSVRKPLFSREGANITLFAEDGRPVEETGGNYGGEGYVYQEYCELPRFGDSYTLVGSWIVDGRPAGIGIREDVSPITKDSSTFVPHFFKP
jgi:glutathionylspermidine synthase